MKEPALCMGKLHGIKKLIWGKILFSRLGNVNCVIHVIYEMTCFNFFGQLLHLSLNLHLLKIYMDSFQGCFDRSSTQRIALVNKRGRQRRQGNPGAFKKGWFFTVVVLC